MDKQHFIVLAGRDVVDFLDMEKTQAADLCRMQEGQARRGYRGAEIVRSMYGWSVRYDSGLQGWGILAGVRNGQVNGTFKAAVSWARSWASINPEHRYVWVSRGEVEREGGSLLQEVEAGYVTGEPDCDQLAWAIKHAAAKMIERMRENYHDHDPNYADEAMTFIRAQLGADADEILEAAMR